MIPSLLVPPPIGAALDQGAALAISVSGGKDSQAMLGQLVQLWKAHAWTGALFAIHANLGRGEWPQTLPFTRTMCARAGIPLVEILPTFDFVDVIHERLQKLRGTGKPFWPSAQQRYCTASLKRNPIDKYLRRYSVVVSAEGVRAEESRARKRKPAVSVRSITAARLCDLSPAEALANREPSQRVAMTWFPLHAWTRAHVFEACGASEVEWQERAARAKAGDEVGALQDWSLHPAYALGNERLSCALCVLASRNDLENGARYNPSLWRSLVAMEQEGGATFKHHFSLAALGARVR
jgi:3'-phosphoadenosine 5'-phosphosulfate sulfotransferase (PAPS reductase)/FAD synthetase